MEFLDLGFEVHYNVDPAKKENMFRVQQQDFSGRRTFLLTYSCNL